ncbi:MAG: hypothetical protein AB7S26_07565 [Sandaracinaceae bacterium]
MRVERLALAVLALAMLEPGCAAHPPDQRPAETAARLVQRSSDCRDPVEIDEVGPSRFAISGCGLLGVYLCRAASELDETRASLAGRPPSWEGCFPIALGPRPYRAAVGDWLTAGDDAAPRAAPAPRPVRQEPVREAATTDRVIRAALDAHARAVLACASDDLLPVRVRWDAECHLAFEPQHDDADVQGCVAAVLADVPTPTCDAAGEPVARRASRGGVSASRNSG